MKSHVLLQQRAPAVEVQEWFPWRNIYTTNKKGKNEMNRENPPAFPRPASTYEVNRLMACPPQDGITMHDLCAIAALQGMCANPEHDANWPGTAYMAFNAADAMMDERNKRIHEKQTRKEKQNESTSTRT